MESIFFRHPSYIIFQKFWLLKNRVCILVVFSFLVAEDLKLKSAIDEQEDGACKDKSGCKARAISFEELCAATNNFSVDCFLGEGGFGRVYKGYLSCSNQVKNIPPFSMFADRVPKFCRMSWQNLDTL